MWRSYSCSLRVVCSIRGYILLSLLFALFAVPSPANAQVRGVFAAATQEIPDPIPTCATSGYVLDGTLAANLLPSHTVIFHRVERSRRGDNYGFIVSRNTVSAQDREVIIYDARTMTIRTRKLFQTTGAFVYSTQFSGEIVDNVLYMVRSATTGGAGCIVNTCFIVSKMDIDGNILGTTVSGVRADNIDDARMSGDSTLLVAYNDGSSRRLATFSIPSTTLVGSGGALSVSAPYVLALNGAMGFQYAAVRSSATKAAQRIPLASITVVDSGLFVYGVNNSTYALAGIPPANLLVGDGNSFGGVAGQRGYLNADLSLVGTVNNFILSDGSPAGFTTFYDSVNNKLHSFRDSSGPNLIRTDPLSVVEQRFNCANCAAIGLLPTVDFIESLGRLYQANGNANAIATRIKVCAVGGPSL